MSEIYDLIIIGSGPAGLSAAIYAERAKLKTLVLEKEYISGGQVVNTYEVDNYPGLPGIGGYELGSKFREHADKLGTKFVTAEVLELDDMEAPVKKVVTKKETYETRTILLATGARHRPLGAAGETELAGMGVSYCATCDGAFFKGRNVVVAGGGDVAVEDALFLARGCAKVTLVHRRNELRAAKVLQQALFAAEKRGGCLEYRGGRDLWRRPGGSCPPEKCEDRRDESTFGGWHFHCSGNAAELRTGSGKSRIG